MTDDTYRELLLGCGHARDKRLKPPGGSDTWRNLVTLDGNETCKPDWLCNLDRVTCIGQFFSVYSNDQYKPFYIDRNYFDEIHAYEVLEHLGSQGDAMSFFAHFSEIYRILKPNGYLLATCPSRTSPWLWGDPSHRRVIQKESLCFLDQEVIHKNRVAKAPMSDFSHLWKGDFKVIASTDDTVHHVFCLQAIKPVREFK